LVAQPEIAVRGSHLDGRGQTLAVRNAERQPAGSKPVEHVRVMPGIVTELERGADAR
jgi:hypothetical protein